MCNDLCKVHWGVPHVPLVLLLGAGDLGDSGGLVESLEMGESIICWL